MIGNPMFSKYIKSGRRMRDRVVLRLKQLIYYRGFIIDRVPDENKLFDDLVFAHEAVQKHELKKFAFNIRMANDHSLYNKVLKKYISGWDCNFTNAEFIGYGTGEYNIDTYRKVCIENRYYFEKVYFNDVYDLLKVEWFYEQIYPILKDHFKTAKLHKVIKGDLMTIVYFEYLDLTPLSKDEFQSVLFDISRRMYKLSKNIRELSENAPDYLKNYISHFQYYKNIKYAEKTISELSDNTLTPKMIEQIINLQPLIITHGDIYHTNVFAGNYIIDWDSFGFFPHGFEVALILATEAEVVTFKSLQEILNKEYKELICKDQWEGFELSCLYFYLIFASTNKKSTTYFTLQIDVFNRIKNLYYKKVNEVYAQAY